MRAQTILATQSETLGSRRRGFPTSRTCLALNASYEPLTVMPEHRAIRLVMDKRAEIIEVDGTRIVRSASTSMPAPAVIRLVRYVHVPRRYRKKVTNVLLFARDGHRCAYCGRSRSELRHREFLTRDHIVPRSRFPQGQDPNTWENCVTSCSSCNHKKGNRTPEEAGMRLLWQPTEPQFVRLEWAIRKMTPLQRKYVTQFFGDSVVEYLT